MKQFIFFLMLLITYQQCQSQLIKPDNFNQQRVKITKQSMVVLGSWAAANIIYSGIAAGSAKGSDKYFHQMNLIWGGINLTLAALGNFGTKYNGGVSYVESLKKQIGVEKTFLLNAGLDVAYITGGFYLKERSKNNIDNKDRNRGYGNSIIMQGSALLLFDGIMYFIHQKHGQQLYQLADKVQIGMTMNGIGCVLKL
jgi:hypothetical protein